MASNQTPQQPASPDEAATLRLFPQRPGAAEAGIEIEADEARNLVRIRYLGRVTAAGMRARSDEIEDLVARMRPAFTMLTDLRGLDSMELECAAPLTRIMDLCRGRGVGTVVRIIPDAAKDIGFNILSLIHYRQGVRIVTCRTLAEAERTLAS